MEEFLRSFIDTYRNNINKIASEKYYELNKVIYLLALKGIGVLNYENPDVSGERSFLRWALRSKTAPVVLDIGAHHGGYAMMIQETNSSAVVHAFEPHPVTYAGLEKNGIENGFKTYNFGFSDTSETRQIFDYEDKEGSEHASLYRDVISDIHRGQPKSQQIELYKLDDFIHENRITAVDLLKIDTEGHEYSVLMGAKASLASGMFKMVHFEFNEMNAYSRVFLKDFIEVLEAYRLFRILPDSLVPLHPYSPLYCEIFQYQNIVAIHSSIFRN
jgi:FkbM family methyltransferase